MGCYKCNIRWYTPANQVKDFILTEISFNKLFFLIRYIIDQGVISPLCELLSVTDAKIIQVALNGLDNILKLGAAEGKRTNGPNLFYF